MVATVCLMAMLPDNGEAPSDNGEAVSYKMKYRELKRRLKILVYVRPLQFIWDVSRDLSLFPGRRVF